ncbi:MAG: RHS repeat domain-containing protein [Planctomycetaceae bacterium]
MYSAAYPDAAQGGLRRPSITEPTEDRQHVAAVTIPSASDTVLVTLTDYDSAGNRSSTTDAAGMVTQFSYDDAGRRKHLES